MDNNFLLNTESEEKEPWVRLPLGSRLLSFLTPNDWRISSNESSTCVRSCEDSLTLREAETGVGTYTGLLAGLTVLMGCFKIVA